MRIGLVVSYLPDVRLGGAQAQAWELAHRLAERHDVTVFTRRLQGKPGREHSGRLAVVRVPVVPVPGFRSLSHVLATASAVCREPQRPDVLLCFTARPGGVIGMLVRRRAGIPFCVSLRGGDWYFVAPHAWGRLLLGAVFERASRVLVQTDRIRRDVERVFPRAAPVVLPNGIEIPPPVLPPAAAGPSLLFVGNLLPRKGVHVLLAALRGCPVIPAVIVGGGPERGRLEALASGLKVEFRGEVPPAAVRDLMRREGRLLVLPAVAGEGQPNVLMEAMSVGLPVVASDVAGVRDLLEDGAAGVVVPPGDPARLAQAVASLWQDEARRAALAAAARVAIEKYAWDRVLPQYEEILAAAARRQLKAG